MPIRGGRCEETAGPSRATRPGAVRNRRLLTAPKGTRVAVSDVGVINQMHPRTLPMPEAVPILIRFMAWLLSSPNWSRTEEARADRLSEALSGSSISLGFWWYPPPRSRDTACANGDCTGSTRARG